MEGVSTVVFIIEPLQIPEYQQQSLYTRTIIDTHVSAMVLKLFLIVV
jgi:hypothetical protein